ncbi:MAG TPA: hypothetical protein VHG35_15910 [Gemmatimonadales bacterium]|nr:hypothetical protein [Gemmatimonadales bacterium]
MRTDRAASLPVGLWACLALAFVSPAVSHAQVGSQDSRVHVSGGGGVLTSGAYFTGPNDLEIASGAAAAVMLQASVAVHPRLATVLTAVYTRPEWELTGVPLVGKVGLSGASAWFADAALRGHVSLGSGRRAPAAFGQIGAGIARYSLDTSVLGVAVDEGATNFAVGVGAGLVVPLTPKLGIEVMGKDYIASFASVRDLAAFGVEGQRAHTLVGTVSARVGL